MLHKHRHRVLAALIVLAVSAPPAARADMLTRSNGRRTVAVSGADAEGGVRLPDALVVAGTDTVRVGGVVLERGAEYSADYLERSIVLLVDVPDTARVDITYLYLPLRVPEVFRHAVPDTVRGLQGFAAGTTVLVDSRGEPAPRPTTALRVGGAKTFGVTMGSDRDLSLEQSLRLNISGRITRDVEVNAYLSDQNTPLSPEGDTEELRAIDKILVEIEGERVSATMGDYELEIDGGPLMQVRRDLKGASASAEAGPFNVTLAGASATGEFASATFLAADGKQGPYLLTGGGGEAGAAIVAGSERVWLDGEALKRGRDNDYVIDYASGEIRFTERRPVTSDNEITVDYEYSLAEYDRSIYGGRGELELFGGAAFLGAGFFRESDDVNTGTGAALSEEQKRILAAAGDNAELARDDGIEEVGAGNGEYTRTPEGHFEYVGPGAGDYELLFERVDEGDYEYEYIGGYYVFAGEDSGDYDLGRSLPLPVDHLVASLDGEADVGGGSVGAQAALSTYDRNRLSDDDDDNNLGSAAVLTARSPDLLVGGDGGASIDLAVDARRVAGNFRGTSRFREIEYLEHWELSGLDLPEQENLIEVTGSARGPGGGVASFSLGRLERGDALEAERSIFAVSGRPLDPVRLWADGRFVRLDRRSAPGDTLSRDRSFYRAGAEYRVGSLTPGAGYTHDERTENDGGAKYDEYGVSLAGAPLRGLSFRGRYSHRLSETNEGDGWSDDATTRTHSWNLSLDRWSQFTVDGSVVRREIDYVDAGRGADSNYDLVSLRVGHRSRGGAVTGETRYTVTSTEVERKERYVTEEDGVEITRIVSTGVYEPVTDLAVSTRWTLRRGGSGGRGGRVPEPTAWRRFLTGVSLETDVRLQETTKSSEKRRLYLLSPSVLQGEDTVRGVLTGRHTLRYVRPGGALSARLAVTTRDELNRLYANSEDVREDRTGTLDVKLSRPGGVTYRVQGDVGARELGSTTTDSYEIAIRGVLAEVRAARMGSVDGRLTVSYTLEDDAVSGVEAVSTKVTPSATVRFRGRGALTASYTRIDVKSSGGAVPTYLAEGRSSGATSEWRLSGDYRVNDFLTASLGYSGERRVDQDARHTLDMRVNAFF